MRTTRRVASWLLVLAGVVPVVATATPDLGDGTFWWSGAASSGDAWNTVERVGGDDHTNWISDGRSDLLPVDEDTYVTTSEHAGLEAVPPARVESVVTVGNLYVGGWTDSFDAAHGDPRGHAGALELIRGVIETGPRNYVRVGTRGADGHLAQRGGTLTGDQAISLGWISDDAVGVYSLDGGRIDTQLHVGVHGLGILHMTGGVIGPDGVRVGHGLPISEDGLAIPGVGLVNQRGGVLAPRAIVVGDHPGQVGVVAVRDGADTARFAVPEVYLGRRGTGTLVQTGGVVHVSRALLLGEQAGSVGLYTVQGGRLDQTGTNTFGSPPVAAGVHVGLEGTGQLTVIGAAAELRIAGSYHQNGRSLLSCVIGRDGISRLEVAGEARFEAGAELHVTFADGFAPPVDADWTLLEASAGLVDGGLSLVGPFAEELALRVESGRLSVRYQGDGDSVPRARDNCNATANESQTDSDGDGYGNACDADFDGDGEVGPADLAIFSDDVGRFLPGSALDCDDDGWISMSDAVCLQDQQARGAPGPSGLACAGTVPCP